jgi:hypothetical protein
MGAAADNMYRDPADTSGYNIQVSIFISTDSGAKTYCSKLTPPKPKRSRKKKRKTVPSKKKNNTRRILKRLDKCLPYLNLILNIILMVQKLIGK